MLEMWGGRLSCGLAVGLYGGYFEDWRVMLDYTRA
jgi:hypothetical protein